MALVLDEGVAAVLGAVVHARVQDDLDDALRHAPHLLLHLLARPVLGDAAHEQAVVVHAAHDAQEAVGPDLVVVEAAQGGLGLLARRELHEAVAAVGARRLHHEAHLVQLPGALQHRHQLVLEHVARDFADEHLAALGRRQAVPRGRGAVPALPVLLRDREPRALLQLLQRLRHRVRDSGGGAVSVAAGGGGAAVGAFRSARHRAYRQNKVAQVYVEQRHLILSPRDKVRANEASSSAFQD